MGHAVYILCALTSMLCSVLLFRAYMKTRIRFLLWSSLGFLCFVINNVILFVDMFLLPEVDLSAWRVLPALIGVIVILQGLIWDT